GVAPGYGGGSPVEIHVHRHFRPRFRHWEGEMMCRAEVAREADLSREMQRWEQLSREHHRLTALRAVESGRRIDRLIPLDLRHIRDVDLRVIEEEDADGEEENERADEQPGVEVQIARPAIQACAEQLHLIGRTTAPAECSSAAS